MNLAFPFGVALVVSLIAVVVLVQTQQIHGRLSNDNDDGVQKIHLAPTPRIGGVAFVLGVIVGGYLLPMEDHRMWWTICLSASFAFIAGLSEDVTKKVGAKWRLLATVFAGLLFSLITGYRITRVDLPLADDLLSLQWFSIAFTAFAIGGIANAINLIDGANGLASGTSIIIFSGLAVISARVGDTQVLAICLVSIGALIGFFMLNFPLGKIFLGDAGAYSVGFILAAIAVMLPARNPDLSPLVGLLALSYPVIETFASIWRRVRRGASPGQPDRLHLHSLIYRRRAPRLAKAAGLPDMQNAATSVVMWGLALLSALLTQFCAWHSALILPAMVLMVLAYANPYRRVALLRPMTAAPRRYIISRKWLRLDTVK